MLGWQLRTSSAKLQSCSSRRFFGFGFVPAYARSFFFRSGAQSCRFFGSFVVGFVPAYARSFASRSAYHCEPVCYAPIPRRSQKKLCSGIYRNALRKHTCADYAAWIGWRRQHSSSQITTYAYCPGFPHEGGGALSSCAIAENLGFVVEGRFPMYKTLVAFFVRHIIHG
jgi:hypothetical protein